MLTVIGVVNDLKLQYIHSCLAPIPYTLGNVIYLAYTESLYGTSIKKVTFEEVGMAVMKSTKTRVVVVEN